MSETTWPDAIRAWRCRAERAEAEIVSLGAKLEAARAAVKVNGDWIGHHRERLIAAEREVATLREALAMLHFAFVSMPDAGLTDDDPRFKWWHDTFAAREYARAALARPTEGEAG